MKQTIFTATILIIVNCTLLIINCPAQSPNWLWAKSAERSGNESDEANALTSDASGNIYVTGSFKNPATTFGHITLNNAGLADMFLVKYDANGNVIWAKSAGSTLNDNAASVTSDASGNIYVAGSFASSSITFGSTTLKNAGGVNDIFLVKYDANGNVIWAKSAGGNNIDAAASVAADASGSVYMTGYFLSTSITFGSTTLTNAGITDMFIVKYDANGNAIWAKNSGGNSIDAAASVTCDASGNVYVAGSFYSPTMTFGSISLNNTGVVNNINSIFLVKYDANGNVIWAKSAGGGENGGKGSSNNNGVVATSVAADASGNVYVTGYLSLSISFGSTTLNNVNTDGSSDIFLVKYDANGNMIWAKSTGGNSVDAATSIAADASGNIYMTGYFLSSYIPFGSTTLTNSMNIFLVKYDAGGNVLWAKNAEGNCNSVVATSVVADTSGYIYIAGSFASYALTFGSTTLNSFYPNASCRSEIFIAKIDTIPNTIINPDPDTLCSSAGALFLPNAFSPNGDGENDFLKIYYRNISCIKTLHLVIYDRWGEKVFETTDPNFSWDGTYSSISLMTEAGKITDTSVFVFYLQATMIDGKEIVKKGNISLIR